MTINFTHEVNLSPPIEVDISVYVHHGEILEVEVFDGDYNITSSLSELQYQDIIDRAAALLVEHDQKT